MPIELRLKIWREALPGPRFREVFDSDLETEVCCDNWIISALLRTNLEARQETLRHFEPVLRGCKDVISHGDGFVNPQVGTIMLPETRQGALGHLRTDELSDSVFTRLKHLAVEFFDTSWFVDGGRHFETGITYMLRFRSLESMSLVITGSECHPGDMNLFSPYGMTGPHRLPQSDQDVKFDFEIPSKREFAQAWDVYADNHLLDRELGIGAGESREFFLWDILWDIYELLEACSQWDPTWKVPIYRIKALKWGGKFSYCSSQTSG